MCFARSRQYSTNCVTGSFSWTRQRPQTYRRPVPVRISSDSESVVQVTHQKRNKSSSKRRRDSERLRKFRDTKQVLSVLPFYYISTDEFDNEFPKESSITHQITNLQSKLVRAKSTISTISVKCAKLEETNRILEEECTRLKSVTINNYVSQIKELEKALDNRKKIMKSKDETINSLHITAKEKEQTSRQISNLKSRISEKDEQVKQKQRVILSLQNQLSGYHGQTQNNNSRQQRSRISLEQRTVNFRPNFRHTVVDS
ncbi:hypothetical protein CI610_03736 [invertebrate metagenome]|uniref:Chromosome partition protein Smc n=1 Tax=invertebrate metagenome TaxID=1711999 RepID=A0A2H9T2A0_9ZZZZ